MKLAIVPIRHAELVSASIAPLRPSYPDKWTLKRVQGDGAIQSLREQTLDWLTCGRLRHASLAMTG
jgi:hypothetical protein